MGEEGSVAFIYYISTRPLETAVVTGGGEPQFHIRTGHLLLKSPYSNSFCPTVFTHTHRKTPRFVQSVSMPPGAGFI